MLSSLPQLCVPSCACMHACVIACSLGCVSYAGGVRGEAEREPGKRPLAKQASSAVAKQLPLSRMRFDGGAPDWPSWATLWPSLANSCPRSDQVRPAVFFAGGKSCPTSAQLGGLRAMLVEIGPTFADAGQDLTSSNFGPTWSDLSQNWSNFAKHWPDSARIGRIWANSPTPNRIRTGHFPRRVASHFSASVVYCHSRCHAPGTPCHPNAWGGGGAPCGHMRCGPRRFVVP